MTETNYETAIIQTEELLNHYGFELRGNTAKELINRWLKQYHPLWLRLAVVEALYQGRYKAVSVEQILCFWSRKGNPNFHFTHEFERLICHKLPRYLSSLGNGNEKKLTNQQILLKANRYSPKISYQILPQKKDLFLTAARETVVDTKQEIKEKQTKASPEQQLIIHPPIHQFHPSPDASEFYRKLKAVAHQTLV